jgi:apolipoprotein N-acyltransferase
MWDADASDTSFEVAARLTEQALALQPDLLVWPEGSFGLSQENFDRIRYQTVEAEVAWIFGGDGRAVTADGQVDVFNSAYLIGATGGMEARYDKCRLVIFGEFIPFENWLPFMRWLTPIGSSFSKGQGAVPFPLLNGTWEASPVICFEDIFAHSTRRHVLDQTDFFLELTNDGWFGESSAQWQHAANVAFRSVENGTPLVRCTNNGITGWFDGCGVLRQILGGGGSEVYKEGLLLANIPRRPMSMSQTIYRRWGDVFGWSCVIGVTMWFAWQGVRGWAGQGGR